MLRPLSFLSLSLVVTACGLANLGQNAAGNGALGRQGLAELNRLLHATPVPSEAPLVLVSRVETVASGLDQPLAIAAKADRAVVVDAHSGWLVQVSPNGATTPLAGPFESPQAVAYDPLGDLHLSDRRAVYRVDDAGTVRLVLEGGLLGEVDFRGIWPLSDGSVWVADAKQKKLFQVKPQAGVRPVELYDGAKPDKLVSFGLTDPSWLTGDGEGNVYLLDGSRLVKISPDRKVQVLKDHLSGVTQIAWHPEGLVVTRDHRVWLWHGDQEVPVAGGDQGLANGRGDEAQFFGPLGIALQPNGQLLIGDSGNGLVRRIEVL